MSLNLWMIGLMTVALALHIAYSFSTADGPPPSELPWVPIQVGKTRSFHSQTRDAGLYTEATRRKAVIRNPTPVYGHKGSTNGSLEWNFLTGICVCPPKFVCPPAPNVVWSDGDADDEICDIVDSGGAFGGYEVVDFGGADATECQL